jgi:hypothetical protein
MDSLDGFLHRLFEEGRVVFRDKPVPRHSPEPGAVERLRRAFAAYRLGVAGPLIEFDGKVAVEAAELVRQASWALVNRDDRPDELERRLAMPHDPTTPAHHLSADLMLRYLPQVYRRAKALDPGDVLPALLERVLRQWPLSGVLSDVGEGPMAPPDLGGHPGLMLLYAERLARDEKPAWRPEGQPFEYLEMVLKGLGKERSALLLTAEVREDEDA